MGEKGVSAHTSSSVQTMPLPCPPPLQRPGGGRWERQAHLIDVGVPHLCQEPKGWRGVRVVDRELEACLGVGQRMRGLSQGQPCCPLSAVYVSRLDRTDYFLQTLPMNTQGHRPGMDTPYSRRAARHLHLWEDVYLYVCECTRNPARSPHHSQAWGHAHNRLPRAFLGSPVLTLIPTLLLRSMGACPGLWSRPAGGSGGWALGSSGLTPANF